MRAKKTVHFESSLDIRFTQVDERHLRLEGVPGGRMIYLTLEAGRGTFDFHRLFFTLTPNAWRPKTHEIGLHIHFDDHELQNYVSDPAQRKRHIERGLEVLAAHQIHPTSFRAGCLCLQPCDVKVLEEGGILVDSSPCPGGTTNHPEYVD